MNYEIKEACGLKYVKRNPEGYREGEHYPVLLYLHGAGSRGTPVEEKVMKNVFFKEIEKLCSFPFIAIAPQCEENSWFDAFERLKALLIHITELDDADPERIYLMGSSMGGYATWQLLMSLPELVAAAVPICGGGMYWNTERLKNVPIWAHHGALDTTVLPEESVKMVDGINNHGGSARLTVYPDVAHHAWIPVLRNPEVFTWLLSHKSSHIEAKSQGFSDAEKFG